MKFPRVNWRRGFFRIWAVLAALWFIAATGFAGAAFLNPSTSGKDMAVNFETGQLDQFDKYGEPHNSLQKAVGDGKFSAHEVRPGWVLYVRSDVPQSEMPARLAMAEATADASISAELGDTRWRTTQAWFWAAIFWPLAILGIGAAIGWALSGFRKPEGAK